MQPEFFFNFFIKTTIQKKDTEPPDITIITWTSHN